MPALLAKDYYCHRCKKGYTRRDKHKCLACYKPEKHTGDIIVCGTCNRTFFGQKCYGEHLRNRSKGGKRDVVCELVQKCLKCKGTVSCLKQHVCGYATCSNCKKYCDLQTHKCYICYLSKPKAVRVQAKRRVSILKRKKTGACVVKRARPSTCSTIWKRNRIRVCTL